MGAKGGNWLLHLAVSPPRASPFTRLSCPLQPDLLQLGAGVIEGNADRTSLRMALVPSIHPKKGSSVNKSIPTRQACSLIGVSQLINAPEALAETALNISQLVGAKPETEVEAE